MLGLSEKQKIETTDKRRANRTDDSAKFYNGDAYVYIHIYANILHFDARTYMYKKGLGSTA